MMKQKNLAILIVILIAAVLAYFLIHFGNERQQEKESQEEEENQIQVTDFSTDDVEKIVFGTGVEKISFEKQDDTWIYTADETFEVDQDTVASLLTSLSAITADTVVKDVTDSTEYGLDDPTYHAEITMTDGSELDLTFGMENEIVSGYYLMTSESADVYLVSGTCVNYLGYSLEAYEAEEEEAEEATEDTTEDTTEEATVDTAEE